MGDFSYRFIQNCLNDSLHHLCYQDYESLCLGILLLFAGFLSRRNWWIGWYNAWCKVNYFS